MAGRADPIDSLQTFLSAGIVTFSESRSNKSGIDFSRMHVSRETTVFYLVFTTLLMAITYGCWWLWQRTATVQVEKQLSVKRANSMEPEKGLLPAGTSGTAGSRPLGGPRHLGDLSQSPLQTPLQSPLLSPPPTPITPMPMPPMLAKSRSTWH
jgi:hypothetical protein